MATISNTGSNTSYQLTYAGVPFCLDEARVIRMHQPHGEQEDSENLPPKKHQPFTDLVDELNRLIPFEFSNHVSYLPFYPGRNLGAMARSSEDRSSPPPTINIGDYYYPNTASRFSIFRGLATSSMVKAMLAATGGTNPATFVMKCVPSTAVSASDYSVSTQMFMLPPQSLAEHGGQFDGLYLVELVDERFYFQGTPVTLGAHQLTTWQDLLDSIALELNITISPPSIPIAYTQPEPDSQIWTNYESAAFLLDAVAFNLGMVVVRNMDATYRLLDPTTSRSLVDINRGNASKVIRVAGGDFFTSGTRLPVGNLTPGKNVVVPASITVTFPLYVQGDDPVPHFLNTRYQPQRPSAWYEESYGEVFPVTVPIASGGSFVSGLTGVSQQTIRDTAKAIVSGEAQSSGTPFSGFQPVNQSGLTALALQIAQDHYGSLVAAALDETYPGIFNWTPEGFHDLIFTYSAKDSHGHATTRVVKSPWTLSIDEQQHATPSLSGFTNTPRGVGGPSVAQTIRDSQGASGQFKGISGSIFLPGPVNSGQQISGGIYSGNFITSGNYVSGSLFGSGSLATSLKQTLLSGDYIAYFQNYSFLPTQNRWRGLIDGEVILFEGTSGGAVGMGAILSGTSSGGGVIGSGILSGLYASGGIAIVYRGIDGTQQVQHDNGRVVYQVLPNTTYGVNSWTWEKMSFTYPQEWTSGGIQGVNVVPQIQTVECQNASPVTVSGNNYYSGAVLVYDGTQLDPWINADHIWLIERNNGTPVLDNLYEGQFVGYSPAVSGVMVPAPVYAFSLGGGGGESFLAQLTAKWYSGDLASGCDKTINNGSGVIVNSGGFKIYSWVRVLDTSGPPFPITYSGSTAPLSGSPFQDPLYHEQDEDIPSYPYSPYYAWSGLGLSGGPLTSGTARASGGGACGWYLSGDLLSGGIPSLEWSVVRVRKGQDGRWLTDQEAWQGLVYRSPFIDQYGVVGHVRYWNQNRQRWESGREIRLRNPE